MKEEAQEGRAWGERQAVKEEEREGEGEEGGRDGGGEGEEGGREEEERERRGKGRGGRDGGREEGRREKGREEEGEWEGEKREGRAEERYTDRIMAQCFPVYPSPLSVCLFLLHSSHFTAGSWNFLFLFRMRARNKSIWTHSGLVTSSSSVFPLSQAGMQLP